MFAGLRAGNHGESLRHDMNAASENLFVMDFAFFLKTKRVHLLMSKIFINTEKEREFFPDRDRQMRATATSQYQAPKVAETLQHWVLLLEILL